MKFHWDSMYCISGNIYFCDATMKTANALRLPVLNWLSLVYYPHCFVKTSPKAKNLSLAPCVKVSLVCQRLGSGILQYMAWFCHHSVELSLGHFSWNYKSVMGQMGEYPNPKKRHRNESHHWSDSFIGLRLFRSSSILLVLALVLSSTQTPVWIDMVMMKEV